MLTFDRMEFYLRGETSECPAEPRVLCGPAAFCYLLIKATDHLACNLSMRNSNEC